MRCGGEHFFKEEGAVNNVELGLCLKQLALLARNAPGCAAPST